MTSSRARRTLAGVLLLGLLAACGTTVPVGSRNADGTLSGIDGGTGTPQTGDGGTADAGTTGGGTGTSAPLAGGSTGGGGSATGASGGSSSAQGGATGPSVPVGRGADGKLAPISIGFTTVPDAAAFFAAFGAKVADVDQAAMFRSAVAWVNANGGLNGHPIKAFIEEVSATSEKTYDQQYQELCAKYTQDDKVVAASIIGIGSNTNMDACMNKARTLFLTGSNTLHDEADYQRTPFVVSPPEVSVSVLAKTLAQLIVARGFEKKGGKVGLLNYDIPAFNRAVDRQLKPILAAAGLGVVQYTIPAPASTAAIGGSVSVVQNAQLKMRAAGVNTVTFLCGGCVPFFIQSANSQSYYPRYVLSSLDTPGAADGATYERALRSSVSVGWLPVQDYGTTAPPSPVPYSSTYDRCLKVQKRVITGAESIPIAMLTCEAVLAFYDAARANPVEPITSTTLRDGMLKLSRPSALNFGSRLAPGKNAGAQQYRLMTWNDTCSCPAYSGPALRFPTL